MRQLGRLVGTLVAISPALGAQSARPTEGTPEIVMQAFLDAVAEERWELAATYLDLAPLEQLRRDILRSARRRMQRPEITADDLMKANPGMPRAVAEYQATQKQVTCRGRSHVLVRLRRRTGHDNTDEPPLPRARRTMGEVGRSPVPSGVHTQLRCNRQHAGSNPCTTNSHWSRDRRGYGVRAASGRQGDDLSPDESWCRPADGHIDPPSRLLANRSARDAARSSQWFRL